MPTYSPKASEITHDWYVIDAEGVVLAPALREAYARVAAVADENPMLHIEHREIRALRIYEGATEVQQLIIGKDVLNA